MITDLGIFSEPKAEQTRQTSKVYRSSLYQKWLLVNHIPAIQGIAGVQDLIKAFAYRGDLYMEKAREFAARFCEVLQMIKQMCMYVKLYIDNDHHLWSFYIKKRLQDQNLFQSRLCGACGDYKVTTMKFRASRSHISIKYPQCQCVHIIT